MFSNDDEINFKTLYDLRSIKISSDDDLMFSAINIKKWEDFKEINELLYDVLRRPSPRA
jgi:hypothetical protein